MRTTGHEAPVWSIDMAGVTSPKVHMGTITGAEGRALYAKNPVILIPVGSHEDQGPHAPMGDYLLAEKIAELTALRAMSLGTPTVVAPVLPYGGDDFFAPMIGGICLSKETATAVMREMLAALHRNKLTRIIFVNGHGGNAGPITEVTREVYKRTRQVIPSLYLWKIAYGLLVKNLGAAGAAAVSGHGADPLTSIGMHLFPDMIRTDMIPEGKPLKREATLDLPFISLGALSFEGHEIGAPHEYDEVYNLGVAKGDPRLCKPETGALLVEQLVDIGARFAALYASKTS